MTGKDIARLFETQPIQWGLRGELFKSLVGQYPTAGKNIYVEKYDVGGMSRGMVSSDFWLQKAFPLLIERATASDFRGTPLL